MTRLKAMQAPRGEVESCATLLKRTVSLLGQVMGLERVRLVEERTLCLYLTLPIASY